MRETKTRVLLIGMSPTRARLIRDTLGGAAGGTLELSHASRLRDALPYLERAMFDAVLLDVPLADAVPDDALTKVLAAARSAGVVLLVRPIDGELAQRGLDAGARAFVVKEAMWEMDAARLLRAVDAATAGRSAPAERAEQQATGAVLGFVGTKGGIGTTSLALRTARTLARRGVATVLVEMSTGRGSLAGYLGLPENRHPTAIWTNPTASYPPHALDQLLCAVEPNLKVLLAPSDSGDVDETSVRAFLAALRRIAGCLVLDLPCVRTPALVAGAASCTHVCVVTEAEPACLRQLPAAFTLVAALAGPTAHIGAVLVQYATAGRTEPPPALCCELLATLSVMSGGRLATRAGDAPGAVPGEEVLGQAVDELVDRLAPQTRPLQSRSITR